MKVVLLPGAPVLLPAYASSTDLVADLRSAVADAMKWLGTDVGQVALLAGTDTHEQRHATPAAGARLVAQLAATYLTETAWAPVGSIAEIAPGAEAVLLLCNGSARRGPTAPGGDDPRAESFDRELIEDVGSGDLGALAGLDLALADQLMTCGLPELRALAARLAEPTMATLDYAAAPFGVQYWVARWETP